MPMRAIFPPNEPTSNGVKIGGLDIDPRRVIIRVRGLKTGVSLDVKEAAGINGASITHQGRKLARWTIEFRAGHGGWQAGDHEEGYAMLVAFADIAFAASGSVGKTETKGGVTTTTKGATPIAIEHPLLARARVDAMVVEEIDWPELQDDKSAVMTWSCIQYAPPLKVNVSKPMQGDVLNGISDVHSGVNGAAAASSTSPQLPQPPSKAKDKP